MFTISSNNASFDQQVVEALDYLRGSHAEAYCEVRRMFPENILMDGGAWADTDAMGVDDEFMSWLADAIEATGRVVWEEGEPWAVEADDNAYLEYVEACEAENLEAHDVDMWRVHGRPTGPLG